MKNRIKTRDWNMVRVIQGATKAAVHTDQRKQASRDACRKGECMETFKCDGCQKDCAIENMSDVDSLCLPCYDKAEVEDYSDDWEDPAITYQRERGEAWEDRYLQWKREY